MHGSSSSKVNFLVNISAYFDRQALAGLTQPRLRVDAWTEAGFDALTLIHCKFLIIDKALSPLTIATHNRKHVKLLS